MEELEILIQATEEQKKLGSLTSSGIEYLKGLKTALYLLKSVEKPIKELVLYGLYSPEDDLMFVHKTKQGADLNKDIYQKAHGEGFYVEPIQILD